MLTNFVMKFSVLALLTAPTFSMASVSYENLNCSVPVCNIKETIEDLRKMNGDQRGMYAINLKDKYKDATDVKVLENLYSTGLAMKKLFKELGDQDWVKRAADDLINQVVFSLAKYNEVNGASLVQYYKLFANQTFRYNLINYWHGQIATVEDVSVLEQLVIFAEGARAHSIAVNDEDWVSRAATSLISDITMKLTHLDPVHEGLYSVQLTSDSEALETLGFDRIAVLDSSTAKNLVVAFINTRLKVTVYSYSHAEISGNTVSGTFLSNGEMANRFSFVLDRATGRIEGSVESTHHDPVHFYGEQMFSTKSVFAGKSPRTIEKDNVIGKMKGTIGGIEGTLTIRSFKQDVYSATFTSHNHSVLMNFQGKFYPKNAVLSFTSNDKIKLTLSYRDTDNGAMWTGASFSTTTGSVSSASFSSIE